MKDILDAYRCECGKLLARGFIMTGEIELKCRFCKRLTTIKGIGDQISAPDRYAMSLEEDGMVTAASESARTILGYARDELRRKNVSDVTDITPAIYQNLWKKLESKPGRAVIFSLVEIKKEGVKTKVQGCARLVLGAIGRPILFLDIDRAKPITPKPLKLPKAPKSVRKA
ncbi:MAG TPA: PAS domain-containing protein [Thermodesulfobacteriota bacterium]|nr:PAS domain-containing protein [Candidatus Paceibacterota bacterium]HVY56204.1 PAS domain-containing protein [Thermodesulfobacteriota bacterium]